MKNKLMLLLTALTFFANSCTTTDKPFPVNTPKDWSPLAPDAEAAVSGMMTFGEFAVTPVTGVIVGAFVAVLAAEASGFWGRQANEVYSFGKANNVSLPFAKEVAANPFEQVGKMHNIGLNYINKKNNFSEWRNNFVNYDFAAWEELIDVVSPGMATTDKIQMVNLSKQARVIERIQAVTTLSSTTNQQSVINSLSLSPNGKAYVNGVTNTVRAMLTDGKTLFEVADYVNGEIAGRLTPKNIYSTEDAAILTFLTVAKHSGYYWHN